MINKNDILEYYFGDLIRYLIKTNRLYLFLIPCIIVLWVVVYFNIRNHKNGYKYNIRDKVYVWLYLSIGIMLTLLFILMLIVYPNIRWKN